LSPSCVQTYCYIDHKERNVGLQLVCNTLRSIKIYTFKKLITINLFFIQIRTKIHFYFSIIIMYIVVFSDIRAVTMTACWHYLGCVQKSYPGAPRSPCAVRKLPVMQTWSSVMRSELFGWLPDGVPKLPCSMSVGRIAAHAQ
jgi:hypothetical protein